MVAIVVLDVVGFAVTHVQGLDSDRYSACLLCLLCLAVAVLLKRWGKSTSQPEALEAFRESDGQRSGGTRV